ncbi:hypothetical protein PIROE2DRAFT_9925, partial [Piromyces sp. E2]
HIAYSYSKSCEPYFSNIDELRNIGQDVFGTNPTTIQFNSNYDEHLTLTPGSILPKLTFKLYDDYDHQSNIFKFDPGYNFDKTIYFNVEIDDPSNIALIGQKVSYCYDHECTLPSLKGIYDAFSNIIYLNITVNECNSTYHFKDIDNSGYKTCYIPSCTPSCNSGNCVDYNLCDCSKTPYTGLYCNEYYKLKRYNVIDIIIRTTTIVLSALIISSIIGVYYNRKNSIIKSGK